MRNQVATVPGASVPPPFGGKYRQIMVYVDPLKLQAHQLSPMDVVRTINDLNLILPAGDAKIGPYDYNIYTNSQLATIGDINRVPLKTDGDRTVRVEDVGNARDGAPDPDQRRAGGRAALGVPAHPQAGGRHQHHRRGGRGAERAGQPLRRAQGSW